jgi:alpha-L-rhamnosidase
MQCFWKIEDGRFSWSVVVPPNTMATVYVPAQSVEAVSVNGQQGGASPVVDFLRMEKDRAVFKVNSGRYRFLSKSVCRAAPGAVDASAGGHANDMTY